MHYKIIKCFIPILFILFTMTGCWDAEDINDKDIIITVVVGQEGENKAFFIEIVNLTVQQDSGGEDGGSGSNKFSVVKSRGKTYSEARENLDIKLDHKTYLGAAQILIFTQEMAKEGIEAYMYRLRELPDYRKTLSIVTTGENPDKLLSTQPENEASAGFAIASTLRTLAEEGLAYEIRTSEILESLSSQYNCFVIPNFSIEDDHIALTDYTIFHHDTAIGLIPYEEAKGLVYLLNDRADRIYTVPLKDNLVTVRAKLKKKDIKAKYTNGEISFTATISIDGIVMYPHKKIFLDEANLAIVEENLKKTILDDVNLTIQQAQKEYACDYLDFNNAFRITYPQKFKELKVHWCEAFSKAEIVTDVKLTLDPGGPHDYNSPIEE